MQFPLSTSELISYLPHKPPMVWIDEVISFSETEVLCKINLKKDAHYYSSVGLRPSSFIEFMAQGYAFGTLAKNLSLKKAKIISKAFLVAVTNATFSPSEKIPMVGSLFVKLETEREMLPIILFKGAVLDSEHSLLAEARLKVFVAE